jgi:hypothetical protein
MILCGGAVFALHNNAMNVTTICKDVRLYMDGGVDAEIEEGGLAYHIDAKLFRRSNNHEVYLGTYNITEETPPQSPIETLVAGPDGLKLSVFKNRPQSIYGYPAQLEAHLGPEKISVRLNCAPRHI